MTENFQGLTVLDNAVAAIGLATTPAEIFRELVAGTVCGAPRAVVFLLREHRWKAWKATGYDPMVIQAAQSLSLSDEAGWLARAASGHERWTAAAGDDVLRFGQVAPSEAIAFPVRVGGKAVAVVMAERSDGEQPWHPEALAVLAQAVRLRLEFDLACRRLRSAGVADAAAPAAESAPPLAEASAVSAASGGEMEAWQDTAQATTSNPEHDEARRFARLVATDIRLYNEEAVAHGRIEGDLAARLSEPMQKGRESFERRFPGLGRDGMSILRESYVQVLAGGDASLIPPD